jgi:hypothetical protein
MKVQITPNAENPDEIMLDSAFDNISSIIKSNLQNNDDGREKELLFDYIAIQKTSYIQNTLANKSLYVEETQCANKKCNNKVVTDIMSKKITEDDVNKVINAESVTNIRNFSNQETIRSIINLNDSLKYIFKNIYNGNTIEYKNDITITPEFIHEIYLILNKDLKLSKSGSFVIANEGIHSSLRRGTIKLPKNIAHNAFMLHAMKINDALKELCDQVNKATKNNNFAVSLCVIAASFIVNFIHISPFDDHNSNMLVANIVANYILSRISLIPVIFYPFYNRKVMIDGIVHARTSINSNKINEFNVDKLAAYMLQKMVDDNRDMVLCLDLKDLSTNDKSPN